MIKTATEYLNAGLCVLPARVDQKRPTLRWEPFQSRRPTQKELKSWFTNGARAMCILCGKISGNAEMIDFDCKAELFKPWANQVPPELLARLVIETTQSGGIHVFYQCEEPPPGNMKLARRPEGDGSITLIETRGEGGIFLCAPSPGYELTQGNISKPPILTAAERATLIDAASKLDIPIRGKPAKPPKRAEVAPGSTIADKSTQYPVTGQGRPGDDYNERGDFRDVLAKRGWVMEAAGENEHWRRPGKKAGTSATIKDRCFYVFSSNAEPFEPNESYSPFAVFATLETNGDYEAAARAVYELGFGHTPKYPEVDISGIVGDVKTEPATPRAERKALPSVPPINEELLTVPGFIGEVMDYSTETAPYPNHAMAFAGALAMQALLAGRKVRDSGDNRTNLYLLGLAHSAAGKDWPRKTNIKIAHEAGITSCIGDSFASGEGLQDAVSMEPSMLFQTDEIDGLLRSVSKSRDARYEAIMSTLLTMYSTSNSVLSMRRKAGKEQPGVVNQPCVTIFGTAIPNHYYEALSERMLTNGFFARMIILESGPRGAGQEPKIKPLPPRIIDTARWWAQYRPGKGNLDNVNPTPRTIGHTDKAKSAMIDLRAEAEAEYAKAESVNDPIGTTVWGRVSEQARKLALIRAVSRNHESTTIDIEDVRWASEFVLHQTRRMLYQAGTHVADSPFHADCLEILKRLREAPDGMLSHSTLLKRMKTDAKAFGGLIETLYQQDAIEIVTSATTGRPHRAYRICEAGGET